MAKCPSCEEYVNFKIEQVNRSSSFHLVVCSFCDTVVGSTGNLDLQDFEYNLTDKIKNNHEDFKTELETVTEELNNVREEFERKLDLIIELLETR